MADFTANPAAPERANFILRVLKGFWNGLIAIGEASAKARSVQALNDLSDEELAARGVTRQDLVKRVFTDGYHI